MDRKAVTQEDCIDILKTCIKSEQFEVVHFKTKAIVDEATQYTKTDLLLEISAKISRNITRFRFYIKKFPTKDPIRAKLLQSVNASEREIYFYENYIPKLHNAFPKYSKDFVPQYLLGRLNNFIVLEDLSLKFYTMANKMNIHLLDRFHISLALKAMAKLHAGGLAFEQLTLKSKNSFKEKDLLPNTDPFLKKDDGSFGYKYFESGIKGISSLLAEVKHGDQVSSKELEDFLVKCLEIVKPQSRFRNVLCHNDLHARNFLFKYEGASPVDCVLLNFQFSRYFIPAYEVLFLIFSTTSGLFRQHYFTYLLKYYYDFLSKELHILQFDVEKILSYKEFVKSVNFLMPAIKLRTVLHLQEHGGKREFYEKLRKDDEKYRCFMFQDKSVLSLEILKIDPVFRIMMCEALEEFVEIMRVPQVTRENCYEIIESRLGTTIYNLKGFDVKPNNEEENAYELDIVINLDQKEERVNHYKYLVKFDNFNDLEVVREVM